MTKRLVMVINDPDFFLSHRLPIALGAMQEGYDVSIVTADGPSVEKIKAAGLKHFAVPLSRRGMNPLAELWTIFSLFLLFRRIRPHIVHLVTIKPVLYGSFAARFARAPYVVAAVSGLGSTFIAAGFKAKVVKWFIKKMYKFAFSLKGIIVIFQNPSDKALLIRLGIITADRTAIIRGSGVDLNKYKHIDEPQGHFYVSMASRILKDKGVYEFVEAARKVKKDRNVIFQLIGKLDYDNPSAISKSELDAWKSEGAIDVLGYRNDIADLFAGSHLVVLPSYREGLPKVLVEAAASGRAVVTTDVPGCRDAIVAERTGLLVDVMNSEQLAEKINYLLDSPDLRRQMGLAGRELAEQEFDIRRIVEQHLDIYRQIQLRKPEVFLITTSLLVVKFFLLPIIQRLEKNYRVTLLVNVDDQAFLERMNLNIRVLHLPIERKLAIFSDLMATYKLARILFKYKPDLVHTVAPKAGLIGILTARLAGVRLRVHTFQGEVWTTRTGLWRSFLKSLDRLVGRMATHLLVVSRSERQFLISEKVISAQKSEVLGQGSICGVNLNRFKPDLKSRFEVRKKYSIGSEDKVIVYIGRLNIDKGILDLIKAFNFLVQETSEKVHLIIVGPDEENIVTRSRDLTQNNGNLIHFESYTDFPEKYMAASDLLVLPSYREGFGLVIMEAAAARVTSVGSQVYGISDAIIDEETGLLFEVGNSRDLADKMKRVITDSGLRERLAEAAYNRCASQFSQEQVIESTANYYKKILA